MIDRVFDVVICGLLVATIVHLGLVQRRLRAFRAERDRLQAFVTALDLTVERAESAIRRMRPIVGGDAERAPEKPRPVRERGAEDLLKAARAAAGIGGRPRRATGGGEAPSARPATAASRGKDATALADALQDAIGG
jgi:hypothetical protein